MPAMVHFVFLLSLGLLSQKRKRTEQKYCDKCYLLREFYRNISDPCNRRVQAFDHISNSNAQCKMHKLTNVPTDIGRISHVTCHIDRNNTEIVYFKFWNLYIESREWVPLIRINMNSTKPEHNEFTILPLVRLVSIQMLPISLFTKHNNTHK